MYAIDWRKGEVRWRAPLEGRCWSTPVLWRDQVIVGAYDGCLHGFDRSTGKAALVIECGGAVKSDPVVVGDLAFVAVDEGVYRGDHDSARVRNILQVIDLSNESILETFRTAPRFRFGPKIVRDGEQVFFFDNTSLFAYDLRSRTTVWKLEAPQGLLPWPIIRGSRVVLAMNLIGDHGEHTSTLMTVDRETGTDARHRADGGVPATMPTYIVEGSHLVMAAGSLVGYHMNLR